MARTSAPALHVVVEPTPDGAADPFVVVGAGIRDVRRRLGMTQRQFAEAVGLSQSYISQIERGEARGIPFDLLILVCRALGARLVCDVRLPPAAALAAAGALAADRRGHGSGDRQLDAAHARLQAHIVRRLEALGLLVATEVPIGNDRWRGFIDILAFDPRTGVLFVIEVKTEIHDLGAVDRQLGWYEQEARAAARRLGWAPRNVVSALIVLATEANEARIRDNRDALARTYPIRARELAALLGGAARPAPGPGRRALAMVDPRSRRRDWLRPTRIDGRRSPAPYHDYADFMDSLRG
jgi:transcriptional regulator with XRE-family HTH domain